MYYDCGDRVALVRTTDPYTKLRRPVPPAPSSTGTPSTTSSTSPGTAVQCWPCSRRRR